ncbi:hypothetical protein K402DRAFT_128 [Aulographum hederae CBS 113979]|uniref:Uncharacterized protein n=1 Tax=Aulographum hederae CBS 113979 TaxID=1176131 RepID=A0A6G1HGM0_9PEZI|nr:hypothetical protein K402DRAFT_128 [Aulographum hederae CBS 113979]
MLNVSSRANLCLAFSVLVLCIFGLLYIFEGPPVSSNSILSALQNDIRRHAVTFEQHLEFYDLTTAGDGNWSTILPNNGGFVVQKQRGGSYSMAGITMFHQLHCLQMIRGGIQELESETKRLKLRQVTGRHGDEEDEHTIPDPGTTGEDEDDDEAVSEGIHDGGHGGTHDSKHWVHCLDYLMQGILCAADGTIEGAHDGPNGALRIDGYGVTHQCHSSNKLFEMAGSHSPFAQQFS